MTCSLKCNKFNSIFLTFLKFKPLIFLSSKHTFILDLQLLEFKIFNSKWYVKRGLNLTMYMQLHDPSAHHMPCPHLLLCGGWSLKPKPRGSGWRKINYMNNERSLNHEVYSILDVETHNISIWTSQVIPYYRNKIKPVIVDTFF